MPSCGIEGRIVFSYAHSQTNPQTCTKCGANQSSSLTASPDIWICDPVNPPKCPLGYCGATLFSICPFPDESADVNPGWCQSVQPFDSFSRRLNCWTPKTAKCSLVSRRAICLAYIHSQMNLHMCAKFGANRSSRLTASTYFWIRDPQNPPKCPWVIVGRIVCPFPDESLDVYHIRCQSVPPFDSFLRLLNLWPLLNPLGYWGATWI